MDNSYLYTKSLEQLKLLARQAGIKLPSGATKAKIINLIVQNAEAKQAQKQDETAPQGENTQQTTSAAAIETVKPKRGRPLGSKNKTTETKARETAEASATSDAAQEEAPKPKKRGRPLGSKNGVRKASQEAQTSTQSETPALEDKADETTNEVSNLKNEQAIETPVTEQPIIELPLTETSKYETSASYIEEIPQLSEDIPEEPAPAQAEIVTGEEPQEPNAEPDKPLQTTEWGEGKGVLEILPDGYGFLRADNCLPGPNDVYLSQTQIRRFNLRNGDFITGKTRPQREGDRYEGMIYVSTVNGLTADAARRRPRFEDLTPIFPNSRLRLENPLGNTDLALRTIDLIAPIGKGQRGLIVSPPKAGKTVLLKMIANAITANYPDVELMVLLIDERPEEVTDMQRSTRGEVFYSTFDEAPENHTRLSEMVLDKAQRQVEVGKDVVILLDSITRLARAYNLVIPPTGRSLSGGLDPGALLKPKKFFGSARNIEFGGSLTIIATALVDTGSRLDDIIYEEFKGTGNMELHLDRKLSERRIFPAIDINRSGTRRDELLYTPQEASGALQIRRALAVSSTQDATEQLMMLMEKTPNNEQLTQRIKGWLAAFGK